MTGALVAAGATCALTYIYMLVREIIRWPRRERTVGSMWVALAFAGWMLAALAVGMYFGERGRRIDTYRDAGRRASSGSAVMRSARDPEELATQEIIRSERAAIKNGLKQMARDEGRKVTRSQLEADIDQIMEQTRAANAGM